MDGADNIEEQNFSEESYNPVDIAEAFKLYNKSQRATAEDTVETGEEPDGEPEVTTNPDVGEPEDTDGDAAYSDDDLGESASVIDPVDLSPQKQNYLKNIQNQAISNVRKAMKEQDIEMWTMEDIYERDEDTGRVTFHNPDDPNRPFQSRAEAQAFIEAMNKEVTNYFRNEVNKEQQRLVLQQAPVLQMFDFAPVYQGMSEVEQGVFNDLIEPYAITDNGGRVIGFNVNLSSVANTARQIAKRFNVPTPEPAAEPSIKGGGKARQQGSKPAMDMKTGSSESSEDEEPKTLGEALKRYDAMQREAEKKGK